MEPTLSFSDDSQLDFDAQAEVRLQHLVDTLHACLQFQAPDGSLTGTWENEVVHLEVASASDASHELRFTVARKNSVGRHVEAVINTDESPEIGSTSIYKVRRLEDGWTTEYTLNPAQSGYANRTIWTWNADPSAAQESTVPSGQFNMHTNAILAELQAGVGRAARAFGSPTE